MMGVADGDRQRIGRVGGGMGGKPRQQPSHHQLHLRLFGMAGADHGLFDPVGGIFGDRQTAFGRGQQHTPRASPSFRVEAGLRLTKLSSTAASLGQNSASTSPIWRNSRASRSASGRSLGGAATPAAI